MKYKQEHEYGHMLGLEHGLELMIESGLELSHRLGPVIRCVQGTYLFVHVFWYNINF